MIYVLTSSKEFVVIIRSFEINFVSVRNLVLLNTELSVLLFETHKRFELQLALRASELLQQWQLEEQQDLSVRFR